MIFIVGAAAKPRVHLISLFPSKRASYCRLKAHSMFTSKNDPVPVFPFAHAQWKSRRRSRSSPAGQSLPWARQTTLESKLKGSIGDKDMASIAVGGKEEIHQIGDVRVNERTDVVYVEDGENAALLERKTTIAEVPQGDGTTAVLADVQYTVRATDQPNEQERDIPGTQRIPESGQRRPPPAPPAATGDRHRSQHPPARQNYNTTNNNTGVRTIFLVRRERAWDKCLHYFYILWMLLLTCIGLVGLGFVILGVFTRKCQKKSAVGIFELWTSSLATGAIMVVFALCVWLSCGAYVICCRKSKALCIGIVTGFAIVAGFFFIIAFSYNVSAVGMTVDRPPTNSTASLHDTECVSPYWLAYMSPFASVAVLLAFLGSLCCCVCCKGAFSVFRDEKKNQYDRL